MVKLEDLRMAVAVFGGLSWRRGQLAGRAAVLIVQPLLRL